MSNISYSAIITIIIHEIKEYLYEYQFNIIAPLINTLLFFFIISTINKYYSFSIHSNSYIDFLIPGMVMTVVIQTSYNHLSEVIISMKQTGSFDDYLVSPISRIELFFSLLISSLFVCLIVGIINIFALSFFNNFHNINFISSFIYLSITIIIFSSLGAVTGFLSFTWDIQSSISNFFIVPISFLSGTFFSIKTINPDWQFLFKYNPFYYLVNGFRSSFIIDFKINFFSQLYILVILFIVLIISIYIFNKGYKVIT